MDVTALARSLRAEARSVDQRRALVVAGDGENCRRLVREGLDAADIPREITTVIGPDDWLGCERFPERRADRLLGETRAAVVIDAHDSFRPNTLGRVAGAVDGGGLLVLAVPPLDIWPDRRDGFDESMAVPPFDVDDVTGRFRRRFVDTVRVHPGVAIVDADTGGVVDDGLTRPAPRLPPDPLDLPDDAAFPGIAYEACLTADQVDVVRDLEALCGPGRAVVVEADRGRGKSSAAGIAAGCLAAAGDDVLVTAPEYRNAREVFARAGSILDALGELAGTDDDPPRRIDAVGGGRVRFESPPAAAELPDHPDVVIVDEAAALPVRLLESFFAVGCVAYATTVHGYEGAGRSFSVRFRDRLDASDLSVADARLDDPIRYAAGDPVESWVYWALLLDARPAVDPLVTDASAESTTYRTLSPEDLLADEHLLREVFGLLVLAHYRTEPDDLARLLDAPNLEVRALLHDGHVASVALVAREGGLSVETRRTMYEGTRRVRGNMIPDVLTSQLRDESAGVPAGYRVMRIATHHAVRSRGLGSRLLGELRAEFAPAADWLGVGFGATPELVSFWADNGYRTVYLSTSRSDRSGEYSALMLLPTGDRGGELFSRHARWFLDRAEGVLSDPLWDLDADVVRATLAATGERASLDLSARQWRVVVDASYGPGLYTADPAAFRRLALAHLTEPDDAALTAREERLLVRKVLQARPWPAVAEELAYVSTGQCMRALGEAYRPLVDRHGDRATFEVRERYLD